MDITEDDDEAFQSGVTGTHIVLKQRGSGKRNRNMRKSLASCAALAFTMVLAPNGFATVYGPGSGGIIPDATVNHQIPGVLNSVINIGQVGVVTTINSVTVNFGSPNHTYAGDIQVILTSPTGQDVQLFCRVGATSPTSFGDSSDLGGTYVFFPTPQGPTFAAAAAAAGPTAVIPPGNYQQSFNTAVGPIIGVDTDTFAVFNGVQLNGRWTLTIRDWAVGDIGGLAGSGGWSLDMSVSVSAPCNVALPSCRCDIAPVGGDGTVNVPDLLAVILTYGQSGPPRPQGDCAPLPNGDCTVTVADLLAVIANWGPCAASGACWLPNNTCTVNTQAQCTSAGGTGWVSGANCSDSDGDRIPTAFETNNCVSPPSPPFYGTNPNNPDTDNDGIMDGDEVYGTLGGLNLPSFGCNPCRKDLLVETDWLRATGAPVDQNKFHVNQVNRVVAAFNSSPVTNPNGVTGIKLHVDYGQAPYGGGNAVLDPSGNDTLDNTTFGIDGEFTTVKTANFAANRNGYFHYCLLHDKYSVGGVYQNSSGLAELPGDDFIVTMSQWFSGDHPFQGNTFMHELGHNLFIRHGGNEDLNFKPNYNSVMNYWYQMCGTDLNNDVIPDNGLDYSRGVHISLDENSLSEPAGVTGAGPAIDWNQNGNSTNTGISRNINCRLTNTFANSVCGVHAQQTTTCGSFGQCYDSTCTVLNDNNDWTTLSLTNLNDGDFAPGNREVIHCWIDDADWMHGPQRPQR